VQPQRDASEGRSQSEVCSHFSWISPVPSSVAVTELVIPSPESPQPPSSATMAIRPRGAASRMGGTYSSSISSWFISPQIGQSGSGVTTSSLTSIVRRS
jgi:hypothetical protein